MTDINSKLLFQCARKLGLQNDEETMQKSNELLRLFQLKSSSIPGLSDYTKCVICIDLATTLVSAPFDKEDAPRVAGVKPSVYTKTRRIIEKALELDKPLGIYEICVQLGVNNVQDKAISVMSRYKAHFGAGKDDDDLDHPQYAAMAVYQACKRTKVKVAKGKMVALSRLKPAQWGMLEKSWDKWLEGVPDVFGGNKTVADKISEDQEMTEKNAEKLAQNVEVIEEYEVWKKRMLDKAYEEIEARKM